VTFYHVEKSPRRVLVLIERGVGHTGGHTMQCLETLCETDTPHLVPWLLSCLSDRHCSLFGRQLLEAAAQVNGLAKPILAKDVPLELYSTYGGGAHRMRQAWDRLKETIGRYSLAPVWNWSSFDKATAESVEAAFAAFLTARGSNP